jgi:hypothetical protein
VLIQLIHSAPNTHKVQLHPELYPRALVILPVDVQKWFLLDPFDGRLAESSRVSGSHTLLPAGRMRRIRRGSPYFQLQPLQRTTTSWEVGSGYRWDVARWLRVEVKSDQQGPRLVSVDITPIYDCDRVSKVGFEIHNFDFRTRIAEEEHWIETQEGTKPKGPEPVRRLSRYQRPLVI